MRKFFKLGGLITVAVLVILLVSSLLPSGLHVSGIPTIGQGKNVFTIKPAYAAGVADFSCDGVDDNAQFQAALDALPLGGGKIIVFAGTYVFSSAVSKNLDNVVIEGAGRATYITRNAVNPVFTVVAGADYWTFKDLRTDAGGIDVSAASYWRETNVWIGAATYYADRTSSDITADSFEIPTGRGATLVVAASNASAAEKAQADYVCDGTADNVEIIAAFAALPAAGGDVKLTEGTFAIAANVTIDAVDRLVVSAGTNLSVANAVTVTINGSFSAPLSKVFTLNGTGVVNFGGFQLREVYPQWWGAILDGTDPFTDKGQFITSAINALPNADGGVVVLTPATWFVSSSPQLKSYVKVVGLSNPGTHLYFNGGTATGFRIPDGASNMGIENMRLDGGTNNVTPIMIYGSIGGNSAVTLRDLTIDNVPSGFYAIDIEWLIRSSFSNLYLNSVGNGIRWQNDRAAASGGNSQLDNIMVNLLNGAAGTGLSFGSASAGHAVLQSIEANRIQVNGNSTANQKGITLVHAGSSVFIESDLELLDYGISITDDSHQNIFVGGYIGDNGTRGVTIDATSYLNKVQGPMRIDGTSAGGSVGFEDLNAIGAPNPNYLQNVDVQGWATLVTPAVRTVFKDNSGYIGSGEFRTVSGSLTAGNTNAIAFAWHDPELQDILVQRVEVEVTTPGGTAGSVLKVGIADDAAGTNLGSEFFTGLNLNAAAIYDSYLAGDTGAQTKWVFCDDSASATNGWVVGQILTDNATALAGKWYVNYSGR